MSSGIAAASSPTFSAASGDQSVAGMITPGFRMVSGSYARFTVAKQLHHLAAVESLQHTGAQPADAVLARRHAAEAHEELGHVIEEPRAAPRATPDA